MKKKIIISLLVVIMLIAGAFMVKIDDVSVSGNKVYTDKEIEKSIFPKGTMYHSLYFWLHSKFFGTKDLPFVQDTDVSFEGIHKIKIQVYEKNICGCVRYMGSYVYFDKDGIVLQSLKERIKNVPLIEGVSFGKFTILHKLEVKEKTLFNKIMNLSQLINHYKINVEKVEFDQGDVILYSGDIKVEMGNKDFYDDEMVALSSVLKTTKEKKLSGTIDMQNYHSGDKIILKTREKMEKK